MALATKQISVTEQPYYHWRTELGGVNTSQAMKLKDLDKENIRLKKLVADL
ncbi:MAG: transposase [Deltaproteobacteria bacterium]|nr:transposase [Deltaproteobacteria bacterium]